MSRVEKEVYKCTRFLIAPREGLDARLRALEEAQNLKIATFQAEVLHKQDQLQAQIAALTEVANI
jgi:hypothetical protein